MADGASSPGCSCFWFMTNRSIYGISIDNLKRLGNDGVSDKNRPRDLTSLPPFPSDFSIDHLPEMCLNPLIHDSKLFLFCNNLYRHPSSAIYQLSFLDNNILRLSEAPPSSVPPLPATICGYHSFGNNGVEFHPIKFRSSSSLFGNHVSVYNRGTGDWEKANECENEKMKELALRLTVVLLPHQKSVAVSWGFCTDDQGLALCRMTFSASMLNLKDFSLSGCQSLDELCTPLGLFRDNYHPKPEVKIVDLDGKGLICALVQGMTNHMMILVTARSCAYLYLRSPWLMMMMIHPGRTMRSIEVFRC